MCRTSCVARLMNRASCVALLILVCRQVLGKHCHGSLFVSDTLRHLLDDSAWDVVWTCSWTAIVLLGSMVDVVVRLVCHITCLGARQTAHCCFLSWCLIRSIPLIELG
ncbi:hypothetical protein AMAG_18761 [Allomyces macrogynus ATCC 38327]|uniref:Secreted protein n=1 Tax=Allomyces macrogynus (strain ATCC 38327) TaxID=578462 RepID=A0A0L0SFG9_ALLM3|nr:hypothetical protein AMAG_18761 [Allomyces macrogynus ATCC 38327]|eukprot:KNE61273.1 hypothetical protein AMAG_18761 [Allomyces macrogynus ATCC 38327]